MMIDFANTTHIPSCESNSKGKIFVGKQVFEDLKAQLGILYGSEFKYQDVLFMRDDYLEPLSMVTLDPDLTKVLEELEKLMEVKQ